MYLIAKLLKFGMNGKILFFTLIYYVIVICSELLITTT